MGGKYSGSMSVEGKAKWNGDEADVSGKGSFEGSTEKIADSLGPATATGMGHCVDAAVGMHHEYKNNIKKY